MIITRVKKAEEIIKDFGGVNLKSYTLINNEGITFDYNDFHFDCRFWANCYGVEMNCWQIMTSDGLDEETKSKIQKLQITLNMNAKKDTIRLED